MEDSFNYIELFETYKGLLTDKQREIFSMHLLLDLSLSEISEEKGITRQNVSDTIKNVKGKLSEYESTLKIKYKNDRILEAVSKIPNEEIREQIKDIIGK